MTERAYVVGDLHLGAGPHDPLEDFFDDELFADLCGRIAGPDTTLILNGDIIDFAQIEPFDVPAPAHLLWTAKASRQKLDTAVAGHPAFFAGLRAFLGKGGRIRFILGNHDLDMVWPQVQWRMWEALGSPPVGQLAYDLASHLFHGVHVEHGHHWTPENCPRDPNVFCYEHEGEMYLERVWGTDFMLQFYNQLERDHPYADNVKPMLKVAWHGLWKGWIGGRELVRLFLFLKRRGLSWKGLASKVLDDPPPLTAAAAVASLDDPAWKAKVLERARQDPQFVADLEAAMAELSPDERRVAGAAEAAPVAGVVPSEEGATLGLFREEREHRAARDRLARPGVTAVVFGHTHDIVDGDQLDGDLRQRLYNYGTWLPSLNLSDAHLAAKIDQDGLTKDMLKDKRLYTAHRRLVRIDADPSYAARVRLVTPDEP